jgi:hypothetical protein
MTGDVVRGSFVRLPAGVLRELAALAEQRELEGNPWRQLNDPAADEALAMITQGVRPALGWWRTHLPCRPLGDWPPMPPIRPGTAPEPWEPWELVSAAIALADDGVDLDAAQDVLAQLAAAHGLSSDDLADAYVVLEDKP